MRVDILRILLIVGPILFVGCNEAPVEGVNNQKHSEPLIVETDESAKNVDVTVSNTIPMDGMEDGNFEKNYPNGALQVKGFVMNGKRSGLWTYYYPAGNKQSENNYLNGELDGKTVVYFPNGQVMYIGYYTNGKSDGQWLYFNEEGTLIKEVIYKNGGIVSEVEKNEKPS